jgi:signal transduction histidine kinase
MRRWVTPLAGAVLTGDPDPDIAEHREWPGWLRWTRKIGIGRIPYAGVLYVVNGFIAWIIIATTVADVEVGSGALSGLGLGIAFGAPVVLRLHNPLAAWRVLMVALLVARLWSPETQLGPPVGAEVAFILVLYSVGRHCRRDLVLAVGLLTALEGFLIVPRATVGLSVGIAACLVLGYNIRQRRSAQAEVVVVQREAVEQATRYEGVQAVLHERQRIARELHDVVAHHMSVIAIQAEAAPYKVAEPQPELAESLADIRALALEGLTELRRILGVLRTEESPETAPQPGLDRVAELVAQARAAGLVVESAVTGDERPVPTATGVSAYRILQEALSNAMRHAPGAKVRIETRYGARTLILSVINGPGNTYRDGALGEAGGGHGVIGMTERAAALGGELIAGPTPGGGFAVTATLPLETVV